MLVYLLATFSEKFCGSHRFTLQLAQSIGNMGTFFKVHKRNFDLTMHRQL